MHYYNKINGLNRIYDNYEDMCEKRKLDIEFSSSHLAMFSIDYEDGNKLKENIVIADYFEPKPESNTYNEWRIGFAQEKIGKINSTIYPTIDTRVSIVWSGAFNMLGAHGEYLI